jgi:hypothetical protein
VSKVSEVDIEVEKIKITNYKIQITNKKTKGGHGLPGFF